jgi:multiple sugar transport system substrate-binding protein
MPSETTILRGIAWDHTRGFLPWVATGQRFEELYPDICVRWEKRSLQAFADASLAELAAAYDLIVMDHPHTALAASEGLVLALDDWLPAEFLADQRANSVGASYSSYAIGGRQWGLATDAAAPIATYRGDLMERFGIQLPQTWSDVLVLAEEGFVTVAAYPVDVLMHVYMFCDALGGTPFANEDVLVPVEVLAAALADLQSFVAKCDRECSKRNPIRTAEWMSATDDRRAAYCPFAYGYSNYSRPGYARYPLTATGLVEYGGRRLRSTLGGAGLVVSSRTQHPRQCMDYARFVASPTIQQGLYFQAGGQPGYRGAWTNEVVNAASGDFFRRTLATLDEARLRGQFPGYMRFQDEATPIAHACVCGDTSPLDAARRLNRLYRDCQ